MTLPFSKMHGIGNDFVLIDARAAPPGLSAATIRAMADRHRGIGFDQLISIEPARDRSCAFRYGIWNADGSAAGQCGNGVRCVAAWLYRDGAIGADEPVRLESPSGPVAVRVVDAGTVAVDMGEPRFDPARIPFAVEREADAYALPLPGGTRDIGAVSLGNPHAVLQVEDPGAAEVQALGPTITGHPWFPQGANAGFVRRLDRTRLELRVHERGSGWTRACGTGACAAMAVLRRRGLVDARVQVALPGGTLTIEWPGPGQPLWMTGPAEFSFEGRWH